MNISYSQLISGEPTLKIAHLSDLHIQDNESKNYLLFQQVLIRKEILSADLVVITGDLTDKGLKKEYSALADILSDFTSSQQILCVPGNHDSGNTAACLGLMGSELNSCKILSKRFNKIVNICQEYISDKIEYPIRLELAKGQCVVFGLDSTCDDIKMVAAGEIKKRQLDILDSELSSLSSEQRKIIVLHHHVLSMSCGRRFRDLKEIERFMFLKNNESLKSLLLKHNVDLVLHGHRHRYSHGQYGNTQIIQASSQTKGCSFTGERFFNHITIGLDSGAINIDRIHFASPAQNRTLSEVFDTQEKMIAWHRFTEKLYSSEDTYKELSNYLKEQKNKLGLLDLLSSHLDKQLENLYNHITQDSQTSMSNDYNKQRTEELFKYILGITESIDNE